MRSTWLGEGGGADGEGVPELVAGRYQDEGLLARGGMGEVRRVRDTRLGRPAAMKLLAWPLVADPEARARFLEEAERTARLQHPGVVAVHDQGELPGGRLWYTMAEVRGETLEALLAPPSEEEPELRIRRLVDIVRRACETMAYAHEQGVVHLDLKPSNLMIGPFGEVMVMDWGLATEAGRTHARAVGTPAYMAPEQALGAPVGTQADVFALGGVLHAVLCGPVFSGQPSDILRFLRSDAPLPLFPVAVPAELEAIGRRALARSPDERYPHAGALADALRDWLDGAKRAADADALLGEARAERAALDAAYDKAAALRASARDATAALPPFAAPALKEPIWALEDEARATTEAAAVREAHWMELVRGALNLVPGLRGAHALLAEHYHRRLVEAEELRSPEAPTWEALLRVHDRGTYAEVLRSDAPVTLITDPADADVEVFAVVSRARRLVLEPTPYRWRTPVHAARLPLGSYVLRVSRPGFHGMELPILLRRGGAWTSVRPGESAPAVHRLLPLGALGADDCLVPAGPAWIGGDPEAPEALPGRWVWIDAFVMRRHPVTHGEYLVFLHDLEREGQPDLARRFAPADPLRLDVSGESETWYVRNADGRFVLPVGTVGPRHPVTQVSWYAAAAYAWWEAERTGLPWRLPDEIEWEKAGRGSDGRHFVWGDQPEVGWANLAGRSAEAPRLEPIGGWPTDRSPYGVEGLAGNCRDWCGNTWEPSGPPCPEGVLRVVPASTDDPTYRAVRGGAFQANPPLARCAARLANLPGAHLGPVGFRLVRTV